jgi:PAS domain S-box-containing protein
MHSIPARTINHYLLVFVLIMGVSGVLLFVHGYLAYRDFVNYQQQLTLRLLEGTSNQIAQALEQLRTEMHLLVYSHYHSVTAVVAEPDSDVRYVALGRHVKNYFPRHYAYTLADPSGSHLHHDDFGERIGDLCRRDIMQFQNADYHHDAYIHPGPGKYHIDVMVPIKGAKQNVEAIFFVSFLPDTIAALLFDSESPGHHLYLVRSDQPDLIEISAAGARSETGRDIHLTDAELRRVAETRAVSGSRWLLVDVPAGEMFAAERARLWRNGALALTAVATIAGFSLLLLARSGRELYRSRAKYQHLVDSVEAIVWQAMLNPFHITFVSQRVESLLGYPRVRFLDEPGLWMEIVAEPDRRRLRRAFRRAIRTGGSGDIEFRVKHADGHWLWVRNIFGIVQDSNGQQHVDGLIINTSEQKRIEQQLAARSEELSLAVKELESFSYSVSHDLRSPLRAIDGFAHALGEDFHDQLAPAAQNYLQRIRNASQNMGSLIDDLLELARVSRKDLVMERVDLGAMVHEICTRMQEQEPDRNVRVEIAGQVLVRGDQALMQIVLQNLLENAWKFTRAVDQAVIRFGCDSDRKSLRCYVCDNGVGFDMVYAGKLFEPFQRLHPVDEYPGTGIGLATVDRIIRRHGGRLEVWSRPGEGACFYFIVPA